MTQEPAPADPIVAGRYRVDGWLGTGGQAVVLRVFDLRLVVPRALKVLLPSSARKTRLRERFASEATTMAMLEHPNVLRVYDVAEADGLPYYVMELVEGGSLARRIQLLGPLEPREAAEAALQVCAGLELAHSHGVIHRDIKPQNVLVSLDGTCKLLDFGIARIEDHRRTRAGAALGTEGYMAPEQARDASTVDVRADVFSVGILTWVMISGRDPVEWLAGRGRERIPDSVRAVIERATEEDPAGRYGSITELSRALAECARGLPPVGLSRLRDPVPSTEDEEEDEDAGGEIVDWLAGMVGAEPQSVHKEPKRVDPPARSTTRTPGPGPAKSGLGRRTPTGEEPRQGPQDQAAISPPRPSASGSGLQGQNARRSSPSTQPSREAQPPRQPSEPYEIGVGATSTTPSHPRQPDAQPPATLEDDEDRGRWRIPLAALPVVVLVAIVIIGLSVQMFQGVLARWLAESERTAEVSAAARSAESHLDFALNADLGLVGSLAELGADRDELDELVAAWEGSSREPDRSMAALALIDHLGSVARQVAQPGSPHSVRIEPPLQRLRAAAGEYRATHQAAVQPAAAR